VVTHTARLSVVYWTCKPLVRSFSRDHCAQAGCTADLLIYTVLLDHVTEQSKGPQWKIEASEIDGDGWKA
jgi:hypothetical protein